MYGSGSNILGASPAAASAAVTAVPADLQLLTPEASGVKLRPEISLESALPRVPLLLLTAAGV
jgi:hypothetical protein